MNGSLTITRPDDWHVHLRDGAMMAAVAPLSARQFHRVLVMPNLSPPVRTVAEALAYRERILACCAPDSDFDPKMSLYLTDETPLEEVSAAADCEHVLGFKLYPAGATTNSAFGVTRIFDRMPVFEAMAAQGVALQVHGEVTDANVDVFDREQVFIDQVLSMIRREIPELPMVLEHITTRDGVQFVEDGDTHVAGTITPQHLLFSRNEMFRGGLRPHAYCLPVLKRETHRQALVEAATGGNPSFFLGTDSAPHTRSAKETDCGCAGVFSAATAIEIYAQVFEGVERLHNLEAFASFNGADFYGLPRNKDTITLNQVDNPVPASLAVTGMDEPEELVPLLAGTNLRWSLEA